MNQVFCLVFVLAASTAFAGDRLEECAQPERWAASVAQTQLKNAGLLSNDEIDFSKTEVKLLASEKKGKDLFHQIQKIVFVKKSGGKIMALTENDASKKECSEGPVRVYAVSQELTPGLACLMDARICPDGTHVGRNPIHGCEFDPCPVRSAQ